MVQIESSGLGTELLAPMTDISHQTAWSAAKYPCVEPVEIQKIINHNKFRAICRINSDNYKDCVYTAYNGAGCTKYIGNVSVLKVKSKNLTVKAFAEYPWRTKLCVNSV